MKKGLPYLLLPALITLAVLSGCGYITGEAIKSNAPPQPRVQDITPKAANSITMMSSRYAQFIDVRTPQEYAAGHIDNAINIDLYSADFKEKVIKLKDSNFKNITIYIVYCGTGIRSASACQIMEELGFKDILNMTGGITEWEAAGLPVEK